MDTSAPGQGQNPNQELCFCHSCENEWYRHEYGLTCPECQSDFTEIVEAAHDPRAELFADLDHHMADEHPAHPRSHTRDPIHGNDDHHPFHNQDTWRHAPDPEEEDINGWRINQTGPDTFSMTGTFTTTTTPRGGANRAPGALQGGIADNFRHMLQGILGNNAGLANTRPSTQQQPPDAPPVPGHRPDPFSPPDRNAPGGLGHPHQNMQSIFGGFQPQTTQQRFGSGGQRVTFMGRGPHPRFQYTANARIFPRNPNEAQPHVEPVDELHDMIQAMLGQGMGGPRFPGEVPPGQRFEQQQNANAFPDNPLLGLLSHFLAGPRGSIGDYVGSQQELDRVISQLMEHNASGSAPGPASAAAIAALPKKEVSKDMLGSEGKAECSICMDEVNLGEQVTILPCNHWFHEQCVGAWLSEHDTCPHCRKGISSEPSSPPQTPGRATSAEASHSQRLYPPSPTRNVPGTFYDDHASTSSSDVRHDFHRLHEHRPQNSRHSSHGSHNSRRQSASTILNNSHTSSNDGGGGGGGGGGIADRIRRGLFGSSSSRRQSGGANP
ncbi:hypothetical protein EJ05DRAFT_473264 [Pseudovirgaria hyperparasitica]|uniref:RING-type E3 ubiquitin transferase n=1 Tax=Pseudovirgaria hyperparasitica TaxID=470096 RepID=A0A6A6WJE6_9PEZI|nr:uncharacterized protein EJ05DRAFT_473264 [Pseudovirgaria hyperparasitica]KAF2762355.1 hypothetical protein EJ05DRAFT_473264 [Pseudovirgaria hyperparasitica]